MNDENKIYSVVVERREVLRDTFAIVACSEDEAEDLAERETAEHDWSDSGLIHAEEEVISIE